MCRNLVGAKVLGLLVMLSVVPYAAFSSNGSLSEVSESTQDGTQTITGVVQDQQGTPLIGVSVSVAGTTTGTATDFEGKFTLKVPAGAELSVTYFGFKPLKVKVGNRTSFTIVMEEDVQKLDDVVVVAYGTQKKESVTAAISTVTSKELRQSSSPNIANALAGRLAGLTSLQNGGAQPGFDDATMYLRGAATVNGTDPLILIDGVPRDNIRTLNANEVETISVLKDASATAVYGVRGANGVILITTKRGQAGQTEMNVVFDQTWQAYTRQPTRVDAWEFMTMRNEADRNDGMNEEYSGRKIARHLNPLYGLDPNDPQYALKSARRYYMYPNHDWYREMFKKWSSQTNVNINVTGGTEELKYFVNAGYLHQGGNLNTEPKSFLGYDPQVKNDRFSFRSNIDYQATKSLSLFVNIGSYVEKVNQPNAATYGGDRNWMIRDLFHCVNGLKPMTVGPLTPGEELGFDVVPYRIVRPIEADRSPYESINRRGYWNTVRSNLNSSIGGQWNMDFITKGLSLKGMASFDAVSNTTLQGTISEMLFTAVVNEDTDTIYFPCERETNGTMGLSKDGNTSWSVNLQASLNYARTFGKHDVGAMLLAQRDLNEVASASGENAMPYNVISYAARFTYGFDNRYFAEVNLGYNGSEQFAPDTRFGFFPAFSAGWVISNEAFMKNTASWLGFLKVRAGWGQNGNDNIPNSNWRAGYEFGDYGLYTFGSDKNGGTTGAYPNRLANPDLTWETSEQTNIGIDARFLDNRLSFTMDWYSKQTKDLLVEVGTNAASGFATQYQNAGTVKNTGLELSMGWRDQIGKEFKYGVNVNMAYNKNEVTEVNNANHFIEGGNDLLAQSTGRFVRMEEGHPIGYFYGYKTDGVIQNQNDLQAYLDQNCKGNAANSKQGASIKPGDLKFVDVDGNGVINDDDKTDLGNPHPDVTMGLTLSAEYKGFDFSVTTYGAFGAQVARSWRKFSDGQYENYTTEVYDYWHGEGTSNRYPLLAPGNSGQNFQAISDIYIDDADYVRIQNLTIGYDFKRIWKNCPFQQLRVYAAAQNLFTFTGYKGMDPENGRALNDKEPWVTGVDVGNYPQPRTYMVGVNVKF